MRRALLTLTALAVTSTAAISAQQTIIVSGGGTALQSAIDQADPGDILIVRAGSYEPITVSEGIAIVCDADVTIFSFAHTTTPVVEVRDLPAGQHFRMRGALLTPAGINPNMLNVIDNRGSVIFEGQEQIGTGISLTTVLRSRQVAFNGCTMVRTDVLESAATFSNCTVRGTCETQFTPPRNCNAIGIVDSRVSVSGGEIRGQRGFFLLSAGQAIYFDRGVLTIAGDASTVVAAGTGDPIKPAIHTTTGNILLDPVVQVISQTTPIVGGAVVTTRSTPSVRARGVLAGETFTADVFCEPGSSTFLLADLPRPPVVTPFGDLWLGVTGLLIDAGVVPQSGVRSRSFTLPPISTAEPTLLQPLGILVSGEVVVGTPTGLIQN